MERYRFREKPLMKRANNKQILFFCSYFELQFAAFSASGVGPTRLPGSGNHPRKPCYSKRFFDLAMVLNPVGLRSSTRTPYHECSVVN
jgi:hypothetical protein